MQRTLMLSKDGQCELNTSRASQPEVEDVAMADRPESMTHLDMSESILYSVSTLHLHGHPVDYATFESLDPFAACPVCIVALSDPLCPEPLQKRLFTWHAHMGRCGGDGMCLHAHEVVKLARKRLSLSNACLGGVVGP
jgi:hypothetical protein